MLYLTEKLLFILDYRSLHHNGSFNKFQRYRNQLAIRIVLAIFVLGRAVLRIVKGKNGTDVEFRVGIRHRDDPKGQISGKIWSLIDKKQAVMVY